LKLPLQGPGHVVPPITQAPQQKAAGAMASRIKSYFEEARGKVKDLIPVKLEQEEPTEGQPSFPPSPGTLVTAPTPTGTEACLPLAPEIPGKRDGCFSKKGITPKIPDSGNLVLRIPRPATIPATVTPKTRPRFFLELCSGPNHPLSTEIRGKGLATLSPLDFHPKVGGKDHDLLDPKVVEGILRLARGV